MSKTVQPHMELARLESCSIDYASHRGSTVISRRSCVCHVATVAAFTQGLTGEFVVSPTEDWATHRRIIGTQWQLHWHLRKVVVASTLDGDDRVVLAEYRCIGVHLMTVVANRYHNNEGRKQQKQQGQ